MTICRYFNSTRYSSLGTVLRDTQPARPPPYPLTYGKPYETDYPGVISWYKGEDEVAGESGDTLTFTPVSTTDQGDYHCRSTFPSTGQFVYGGVTRSEDITLTVHRKFAALLFDVLCRQWDYFSRS